MLPRLARVALGFRGKVGYLYRVLRPEEEHRGSIWKHPYMLYVILTTVLFLALVLIGWVAWDQGWIPNRGTSS